MSHWAARPVGYINHDEGRKGHDHCWHDSDLRARPLYVRYWGYFGRDVLAASISLLDPKRTSDVKPVGRFTRSPTFLYLPVQERTM